MKKIGGLTSLFRGDKSVILEKVKESLTSVLPISLIVLVLSFSIAPIDSEMLASFIFGSTLVIFGTGLFSLGADVAMTPIGEYVGNSTIKTKKMWIIIPIFFVIGVLITIAEPDLTVLAEQLSSTINKWLLIISVGVGVGLFLVVAFLRIIFKIKLKYLLLFFYLVIFVMAFFVPKAFLPLSFDAGGVTTGPMSVPFIIAIGTGIAMSRNDQHAKDDSFGLTALCSVGPILSVMILGLIFSPDKIEIPEYDLVAGGTSQDLFLTYVKAVPKYLGEVGIAFIPIIVFFVLFQIFGSKLSKRQNGRISIGVLYTYLGLVIFLLGVNEGFLPVGNYIGKLIGMLEYNWIAVPIGMILGFFVVAAEPAVHVLTKQVYEITSGGIPKKALSISLMIGVAVSVGLSMLRILLHIDILWFLVPFYLIALVLMFFVPDIFTAVAFDSGGVASGAMATGFILPFALGVCSSVGGDIAREGFGVVAMVAMTPLVAIQILGLVYKIKLDKLTKHKTTKVETEETIVENGETLPEKGNEESEEIIG